MAPADQPVHFLDRVYRSTNGAVAVGVVLEVRLEDRFQHALGAVATTRPGMVGRPSGRAPPPALGSAPRRTGSGRYVFETSSSRKPANQASTPDASICLKVTPSTPGTPA